MMAGFSAQYAEGGVGHLRINTQEAYLQAQVQTATPEGLVTLLYDGALRFLRQARGYLAAHDVEGTHQALVRVQDIVVELNSSLDLSQGEVAASLRKTYEMLLRQLVEANARKDVTLVDAAIQSIEGLREAWVEASKQVLARRAQGAQGGPAGGEISAAAAGGASTAGTSRAESLAHA